ncbi:hypothetical protein [Gordonia bronchialis]|uniref:hypothetical protein n=1 Tax=Gordonia bronchialis TaxID=2054 RepID=UPI00226E1CD5|nr:hypothetical protein [Gordonia bronchialis]
MADVTPEQARAALAAAEQARDHVADGIGLPRAYWWAMAAGWAALGAIGEFTGVWVVSIATLVFGAGHAALASRLLDGRRKSSHVQVARSIADRRIPLIVVAILVLAVVLTIALALALKADGLTHPTLWAGIIVGAVVGLGGPEFLRLGRRWIGA